MQTHLKQTICYLLFVVSSLSAVSAIAQTAPAKNEPSGFTARLMNIENASRETFRYTAKLHNGTNQSHVYEFNAIVPEGWNFSFKAEGMQTSAFNLEAGKTQDISIEVNPSPQVKPGKYTIAATAVAEGQDTLHLRLEAVIKGTYAVQLSTPDNRLSDKVTEGTRKEIHLVLLNTGSLDIDNLQLSAETPSKWDVTFESSTIPHLKSGQRLDITATLNVPDKTIAGDYVTTFNVKSTPANGSASFRMTVETSALSGWIGMLVILLAIGLVWYLIRKYGRR